jgi:hypothetical protein
MPGASICRGTSHCPFIAIVSLLYHIAAFNWWLLARKVLGAACCWRSSFSLVAQAQEETMQKRRSWQTRILALAWPAALMITVAVNPAAQAGTTGALETKLRLGGPVPVKSEPTKSAATSAIVKSDDAAPAVTSPQAPQPQGDPPLLVLDAWVWRCDPTAMVAVWSPKALCEDFVALR